MSVPALASEAGRVMPALAPVTVGVAVTLESVSPLGDVVTDVVPSDRVNTPGSLFSTSMVPGVADVSDVPEIVRVPALAELKEQAEETVPENRMLPVTADAEALQSRAIAINTYFIFLSYVHVTSAST